MFSGQPAGVERILRVLQSILNPFCEWVRVTEHAPRDLSSVLERLHSLAEIVVCGGGVPAERLRVSPPHPERDFSILTGHALCHGYRFAHQ